MGKIQFLNSWEDKFGVSKSPTNQDYTRKQSVKRGKVKGEKRRKENECSAIIFPLASFLPLKQKVDSP